MSYELSVCHEHEVAKIVFAVQPDVLDTIIRTHEKFRLGDGRVRDAVVRHPVHTTDNDDVLPRKARDDELQEFGCVPDSRRRCQVIGTVVSVLSSWLARAGKQRVRMSLYNFARGRAKDSIGSMNHTVRIRGLGLCQFEGEFFTYFCVGHDAYR